MKKRIYNELKKLRYITPDAARKDAFRSVLQAHMHANPSYARHAKLSLLRSIFFSVHKPALAFLLIMLLLMGTSGVTFASQSALPGETLYPVKLATEKVRIAFAAGPTEKTKLHLQFASRRLSELGQITDKETVQKSNIDAAFTNYKAELEESQMLLSQNPQVTAPIATLIDEATTENQRTIKTLSEKTRHKAFSAAFRPYLEDADDHAESKNETANLALLDASTGLGINPELAERVDASSTQDVVASSTEPVAIHNGFKEKSHQKIESVKARIQEMEQTAQQSQTQGSVNPDASQKIEQAKNDLQDAENQLERGSYRDSFITSIRARKSAQDARNIIERERVKNEQIGNGGNRDQEQRIRIRSNGEDD